MIISVITNSPPSSPPDGYSHAQVAGQKMELTVGGQRYSCVGTAHHYGAPPSIVLVSKCSDCQRLFSQHLGDLQLQNMEVSPRCPAHPVESAPVTRIHPDARAFQWVGMEAFYAPGQLPAKPTGGFPIWL